MKFDYVIHITCISVCLVALTYQAIGLCQVYLRFPTQIQLQLKPYELKLLSVSICRSVFGYLSYISPSKIVILKKRWKLRLENEGMISAKKYVSWMRKAMNFLTVNEYFALGEDQLDCTIIDTSFGNVSGYLVTRDATTSPCTDFAKPIHTCSPFGRCVTYFSQDYVNYNVSDNVFDIADRRSDSTRYFAKIRVAYQSDYRISDLNETVLFLVHSRDSPIDNNLGEAEALRTRVLLPGVDYLIYITKSVTVRLPPPYDTQCSAYPARNFRDFQSRKTCQESCLSDALMKLKCAHPKVNIAYEYGKGNRSFCTDKTYRKITDELDRSCERLCPLDCHEETITSLPYQSVWQNSEGNKSDIRNTLWFGFKTTDQIHYVHIPKIYFVDFMCGFGGLMSFWLGLSVFGCHRYLSLSVKWLSNKSKPKKGQKRYWYATYPRPKHIYC